MERDITLPKRLLPLASDDVEMLPLGFAAAEDIARGGIYMDESGRPITAAQFSKQLRELRGRVKVVRIGVRFWMPGDPKDEPPRERVVTVPVVGEVNAEDIGRAVHEGVRRLYDAIRRQPSGKRGRKK